MARMTFCLLVMILYTNKYKYNEILSRSHVVRFDSHHFFFLLHKSICYEATKHTYIILYMCDANINLDIYLCERKQFIYINCPY